MSTPKKHDHRQSLWIIAGGELLWCYRCGAWRLNRPGQGKWWKPTGPAGEKPYLHKPYVVARQRRAEP